MNTVNLREEVQRVIAQQWPAFAAAHPHLAEQLEQSLLIEPALESLQDDAEFQAAMERAATAGAAGEFVASAVARVVEKYLHTLL